MLRFHKKTVYEALGRESVHPFPARMAPGIALELMSQTQKRIRVLDPMMGSGTVLAMARSWGHKAVGFDLDPLAVLISKVWTTSCNRDEVRQQARNALSVARTIFESLSQGDAYPRAADDETRAFISYWFDGYARRQLAALSEAIDRVHHGATLDILWCAFSRLIITKQFGASLAMDLSHSRPHRVFERAPAKPFRKFLSAVERVLENTIDSKSESRGPAPSIHEGDARQLPLNSNSVDLVLTSPPYLNAIDYIRCSKFSLVWMGYSVAQLRQLRTDSIGTEVGGSLPFDDPEINEIVHALHLRPRLDSKNERILARYIDDMRRAIREVSRVLSPSGKAVYVVGENTLRDTYVRTSVIVSKLAEIAGLTLKDHRIRTLPPNRRYLPPPSSARRVGTIDARMRREVVLTFAKRG